MMPPQQAMLLAAGFGTRMRPLTDALPKPLLCLSGRSLLDHALDRLHAAGIRRVIVNAHWQGEALAAHLAARPGGPETVALHEEDLLDTGGAVAAAYARGALAEGPAYVVNGDAFWVDGPEDTLHRLAAGFDPAREDATLLLHRTALAPTAGNAGDFRLDPLGVIDLPDPGEVVPYVYAGVQILVPALLAGSGPGRFGMFEAWVRAIAANRLRGMLHDGLWFHLSRPSDLAEAEAALATGETAPTT